MFLVPTLCVGTRGCGSWFPRSAWEPPFSDALRPCVRQTPTRSVDSRSFPRGAWERAEIGSHAEHGNERLRPHFTPEEELGHETAEKRLLASCRDRLARLGRSIQAPAQPRPNGTTAPWPLNGRSGNPLRRRWRADPLEAIAAREGGRQVTTTCTAAAVRQTESPAATPPGARCPGQSASPRRSPTPGRTSRSATRCRCVDERVSWEAGQELKAQRK